MDWISGWSKRIKFNIDHTKINSTLVDFPILLNLDTTCSDIFNELGNNERKKISILLENGTNCYCEIERWDYLNNDAQLWIKVPELDSNKDTKIYLYYDSNQQENSNFIGDTGSTAGQKVWDDDFICVYHMSQDPHIGGECIIDSTSNNYDGSIIGTFSSAQLVNGPIGKAIEFTTLDNFIKAPTTNVIQNVNNTMEATVKYSSGGGGTWGKGANGESQATNVMNFRWNGNSFTYYYETGGGQNGPTDLTVTTSGTRDGEFHNLSTRIRTATYTVSVDSHFANYSGNGYGNSTAPVHIGPSYNDVGGMQGYSNFLGTVREFRSSSTDRSDDWLVTTNYSTNNELVTFISEEIQPTGELNYQNKIKLSIPYSYIDNSLYNFPILVNLSSASGLNNEDITEVFTHLGITTNRKKIAVTDYTGVGQCFVEIERWSQAEHSAQLWIKVPEISSTSDTTLYLYYDKTKSDNSLFIGDTSSFPAQQVWDDNFIAVYHMSQDPSAGGACILDSTSNENHGTPEGILSSNNLTDGNIGKAIYLNGSDNLIDIGDIFSPTNETLEVIFSTTTTSTDNRICLISDKYVARVEGVVYIDGTSNHRIASGFFASSTWYDSASSTDGVNDGVTHYVCMTYNTLQLKLFLDNDVYITSETASIDNENTNWIIGANWDTTINDSWFEGNIGEVRVSNNARSDVWISTTYKSNFDNLISYTTTKQTGWLETYEGGELSPWTKRIKLEIDNTKVDSHLVDFPVLINLSESSGYNDKDNTNFFTYINPSISGDTFNGEDYDVPDTFKWGEPYTPTPETTNVDAYILSNNLRQWNYAVASGASESSYLDSNFTINGDFDINIQISSTSVRAIHDQILFRILDEQSNNIGVGYRHDGSNPKWYSSYPSTSAYGTVSAGSGSVRITRVGATFTTYYDEADSGEWVQLQTKIYTETPVTISLHVYCWGALDTYVNWDNLTIISGTTVYNNDIITKKIAVSSDDGTTQLPVEIGNWDTLNKSIQLWTKVPNIVTEEKTILYLYYDIDKSDNTGYVGNIGESPAKTVWDDYYTTVCHLSQDPSGLIYDSKSSNNFTTYNMSSINLVDIHIGKGIYTNGVDEYMTKAGLINLGDKYLITTIEIVSDAGSLISTERTSPGFGATSLSLSEESARYYRIDMSASPYATSVTTASYGLNTDINFLAFVSKGGNDKVLHYNSNYEDLTMIDRTYSDNVENNLDLGRFRNYTYGTNYYEQTLGELRISSIVRTNNWIQASRISLFDELIFYNTEETYTAPAADPIYYFHGYIKEAGNPVARVVNLYNRSTGILADTTVSNAITGYYELATYDNVEHFIVVIDDDGDTVEYNAIIQDRLIPNGY